MLWRIVWGAALVLLSTQPCMAEDAPLQLAPSGPWRADYAEDSCALQRDFSSGEESVTLRLRQFAPDDLLEITLASDTFRLRNRKPRYRFEPEEAWHEVEFHEIMRDGKARAIVFSALLHDKPSASVPAEVREARERAIEALTVEGGLAEDVSLRTGPLEAPMKAMRRCLDDLVGTWGLDPATQRSLSRRVADKEGEYWPDPLKGDFRTAVIDWPSSRIEFLLFVDEAGHIGDCRIVNAPREDPLSVAMCNAVPRDWQFVPALDADGRPTKSYHRGTITRVARGG